MHNVLYYPHVVNLKESTTSGFNEVIKVHYLIHFLHGLSTYDLTKSVILIHLDIKVTILLLFFLWSVSYNLWAT